MGSAQGAMKSMKGSRVQLEPLLEVHARLALFVHPKRFETETGSRWRQMAAAVQANEKTTLQAFLAASSVLSLSSRREG